MSGLKRCGRSYVQFSSAEKKLTFAIVKGDKVDFELPLKLSLFCPVGLFSLANRSSHMACTQTAPHVPDSDCWPTAQPGPRFAHAINKC